MNKSVAADIYKYVCVLTSLEIKGVRTSKHSCSFTEHIKEKLSNKGGGPLPFPSLVYLYYVLYSPPLLDH